MFDHVTIRVTDRGTSRAFYRTALQLLGREPTYLGAGFDEWGDFSLAADGHPVTRNFHLGFAAPDRDHVDRWWRELTAAGYTSDGEPGPRPEYGATYYGAFILDPDGNSTEAVHHSTTDADVHAIDHVWLRTRDLDAAKRFYDALLPLGLFSAGVVEESRVRYRFSNGSFSFVTGNEPTENVHLAFAAASTDAVDAFHATLVAAGYRDNGPPGERPRYHPGYYGAFVLDPDGHNVEAVFHDRG